MSERESAWHQAVQQLALVTCPLCAETCEPAAVAAGLAICGCCGATLRTDGEVRAAVHQDVDVLGESDLHALTKARRLLTRKTKTLSDADKRAVEKARAR